ncbi:MAG: hypothetical protein A3I05_05785 [Deltaproteobacteria bacterium RIFCSPLOWO2_02_FULL_44_10]|nr:MAG: hypothetical protein A3C46_04610 [Deltaproteobacteria bacterium RIFCSPHIGHO2_02_FULL_44_16]OGQ46119.1 MAG: hypothetical protein A3I05_05785 [Deltaproteobacteria bacterium RIFCSPLOWO2_02_FULL_44_10]
MGSCLLSVETVATGKNETGALARATLPLAQNKVNIDCTCCYSTNNEATFHFVTNNASKAKELLSKNGFRCTENEVCRWSTNNHPGILNKGTTALAEAGIEIEYCYTATPASNNGMTDVIFCTNNNKKAAEVLRRY